MSNSTKQTLDGYFEAKVKVLWGNRKISAFMRSAGLGITGVGIHDMVTMSYKPGEFVDNDRVLRAFAEAKRESDKVNSETELLSFEVTSLYFVPILSPTEVSTLVPTQAIKSSNV